VHIEVLNLLCPYCVYSLRRDDYIVDNKVEKKKKRRDRFLINKFKKKGELNYLESADELSIEIKKLIRSPIKK